jgi:MFS family permease
MPSIVEVDQLEKANGRMWSVENIANTFIGPPLGSLLLIVAFSLPFFVDAASFFAAAALVAAIPGTFRAERPDDHVQAPWRSELAEGFRWLWANDLLRSMAIILGLMNLASTLSGSVLVLFAQEILNVGPFVFTIMGFGFAAGAAIGGNLAPWMSRRLGSGTCLAMTLGSSAVVSFVVGLSSQWPIVMVMYAVGSTLGATWNVITVSLRQSIIPPHLLGRVNSVYRFFAWGMMPIGAALGGITVTVVSHLANRRIALRSAFFLDAAIYACLFVIGRSKLTTAKLEAARSAVPA